ncbi:hypothetical protein EZV62_005995 [Acer yangbiense]|uniref:Glutamyl/glutaminyl-tRNA synthetase class Ib catalytic domain-containing protein n=1 Tax=Acer yangbiense TaxID=1000413 RepID=A0A5C7IP88_9ROSI|nr:hypothetical protein EZV62_005995 [Acer yangbiense]
MSADMATGSSVALQVPQFSGENYQIWVVKMKSYLKSFGLWEYVAEDKQYHAPGNIQRNMGRAEGKDSESVKDYSSKLSKLVNQMRLYGETVEDYKVVEKMLISLPEKFEAKVAPIEESCDLKKMTISEMVSKLQAQEQRMSMRNNDVIEGAFQARHKGKQPVKRDQQKQNFDRKNGDQKGKGKIDGGSSETAGKSKFPPCSTYKRPNHLSKPQHAQQANFTDEQPEAEDHMFMASQACCSASKDVWYVDSGCTSHMVKDSSLFTSLDSNDRTNVKLGNGEMVQATGKGTVSMQTSKGPKLIHDVLLIPDLDQNLLSVAQLLKKGYSCSFKDNYCTIVDSCGVEVVKHLNSALWHKRYGHFNMDALKYLQDHDMVRDMQETSRTLDDLCDACQLGKMHRKPFSLENVTRAENKLELIFNSFEVDLPDAEIGKVRLRFAPEPSGYLHIGHSKAALLNQYFAQRYQVTYTSDYFPDLMEMAETLIRRGKAYVDDTPRVQMQGERMVGIESKCRNNSVEENMKLWKEMIVGSERGLQCCLRGKLDMKDPKKSLRDPVYYRCNPLPHHRIGSQYKIYPTYDFACPFVDARQGISHALRSSEYHDRNAQYYRIQEDMGMRMVHIYEFSRLNMVYTLLSKCNLLWFVQNGKVDGWDDPCFPTNQGIVRRGLKVEALIHFILEQGALKNLNLMEWDKLWTINKKIIDPVCPRHTVVIEE